MTSLRAGVMAVALLGSVAVEAPSAAAQVTCGDVVRTDVRLTHDLVGCPADGLVIGASGITVDLDGHTISGDGDTTLVGGAGIRVPAPFEHVIVRRGVVRAFSQGVVVASAWNRVAQITATDNVRGIDLNDASHNAIVDSIATSNDLDGIRVDGAGSDGNEVGRNAVVGNAFGISVSNGAERNRVTRNALVGNARGIAIFGDSDDTDVSRNEIRDSAIAGIDVQSLSDRAAVTRNLVTGNALGVILAQSADGALIERNDLIGNGGDAIRTGAANGVVSRNQARGNGGYGIRLTETSAGNRVSRNELVDNALGAILDLGAGNILG